MWTVKSTMQPAPQMATIVATTNNMLTNTFIMTTLYSKMQKPCKFGQLRYAMILKSIKLNGYINQCSKY